MQGLSGWYTEEYEEVCGGRNRVPDTRECLLKWVTHLNSIGMSEAAPWEEQPSYSSLCHQCLVLLCLLKNNKMNGGSQRSRKPDPCHGLELSNFFQKGIKIIINICGVYLDQPGYPVHFYISITNYLKGTLRKQSYLQLHQNEEDNLGMNLTKEIKDMHLTHWWRRLPFDDQNQLTKDLIYISKITSTI